MSQAPSEVERLNTILERVLKFINDALNKPPSEIALLAELQAQLLVARKIATEQSLSERDALIQAASAATSFSQLEEQIAIEERAPSVPGAPPPQRKPYTLDDARAVLADSRIMAQQLFFQRTGSQPDAATASAIDTYVIDNLLTAQRGVPKDSAEEIGEQVVSAQREAIGRFPGSVTLTQRLSDQYAALRDSDNPNASISPETYVALVFPATPLNQVPARFRASVPVSDAAERDAELKALDVFNSLASNSLTNLQKVVDIAKGPTGVTSFGEGFARLAGRQTEEEVEAGTNTLPAVNSPSAIRAQRRATEALGALTDETSTKKAVEDVVGSPGLETDPVLQKNKTQAVRRVTDEIQTARRAFLEDNPGATKEAIDAHLAPILAQAVADFDQTLAAVTQEVALLKFGDLESTKKELRAILGAAGLDAASIDEGLLTQAAQFVMQTENPAQTAQQIVPAFSVLQQESVRLESFGDLSAAKKSITAALGSAGLDVSDIPEDIFAGLAFGAVQTGGINEQAIVQAFPALAQFQTQLELQEGRTEAATPTGAKTLRDQALFDLGEVPASFTQAQLDTMSQFIAQSGGAQNFERVFGPRLEAMKQDKVLGELPTGGFEAGAFPTFEQVGALESAGLGIAPIGQIAALRPGQTQSLASIRGGIAAQLGQSGIRLPFAAQPSPEQRQANRETVDVFRNIERDVEERQRQSISPFTPENELGPLFETQVRQLPEIRGEGALEFIKRFPGALAEFARVPEPEKPLIEPFQEEVVDTAEAERDRRRLLRGGRTIFQRV